MCIVSPSESGPAFNSHYKMNGANSRIQNQCAFLVKICECVLTPYFSLNEPLRTSFLFVFNDLITSPKPKCGIGDGGSYTRVVIGSDSMKSLTPYLQTT